MAKTSHRTHTAVTRLPGDSWAFLFFAMQCAVCKLERVSGNVFDQQLTSLWEDYMMKLMEQVYNPLTSYLNQFVDLKVRKFSVFFCYIFH